MKTVTPWLSKLTILTLIIFGALLWSNIGRDYLFDWDEGIYAVLGREMIESKNWLTPTWNGELWLEKPPLVAWVSAIGMTLTDTHELGARLLMPAFALATLYGVFRFGERLGGTVMGSMSMAILGYFNLFLSRARSLNTDGMLLAAITWVSYLTYTSASPYIVGIVAGLAVMAKGISGLLTLIIALPFLYKKSRSYILSTFSFLLLTILPWHLYAYIKHGSEFVTPYLMEQVIVRATVPIEFHLESRWFYLEHLYSDLGLGVVLVATLGISLIIFNWTKNKKYTDALQLIWWIALPLVIFTLAKTRLPWYILPVYPAVALLVGYALTKISDSSRNRVVLSILSVGMLAQMLWGAFSYIDWERKVTPLADRLEIASQLQKYPGNLSMLVSESERVAQAILPADQTISSSFRYGGAPSVLWYSHKRVKYYYNYDEFKSDTGSDSSVGSLIVTTKDKDKVPDGYIEVVSSGDYLGYVREGAHD